MATRTNISSIATTLQQGTGVAARKAALLQAKQGVRAPQPAPIAPTAPISTPTAPIVTPTATTAPIAPKMATLVNKQTGDRKAVAVGSQDAQSLFGQGYVLEGAPAQPAPGAITAPIAPTQQMATLVNKETGDRQAVPVGSQEAQTLFGQGYVLETQAPTLGKDLVVDVPQNIPSDVIQEAFAIPKTESDIQQLIQQNQKFQAEYLKNTTPDQAEQTLQVQLNDIRAKTEAITDAMQEGVDKVTEQPIPYAFLQGQSASIVRHGQRDLANLARVENNLVNELGLAQSARTLRAQGALTASQFFLQNVDLAFQMKDRIQAQEDRVFNRAMALQQNSRQALTMILETMKGVDPENISAEDQQRLAQISAQSGIPYDLVVQSMKVLKHQVDLADWAAGLGLPTSSADLTSSTAQMIVDAIKQIESGGNYNGPDGAAGETGAYQFLPETWNQYAREYLAAKYDSPQPDSYLAQTPENQDAVALFKVQQWLDQGWQPEQIASMWNAGPGKPNAYREGWKKTDPTTGQVLFDTPAYVQRFRNALNQQMAQQAPPEAQLTEDGYDISKFTQQFYSTDAGQKIADDERAERERFLGDTLVKEFRQTQDKYAAMTAILSKAEGKYGVTDVALVYEFMKALDPTSVVREAEFENASKSGNIFAGAWARFNGYLKVGGGTLPQAVREAFRDTIGAKLEAKSKSYRAFADRMRQNAYSTNLNPDHVVIPEVDLKLLDTTPEQQYIDSLLGVAEEDQDYLGDWLRQSGIFN